MTTAAHLLRRIASDPRLAWYFDPFTQSMEMLTADYARENSLDVEEFRKRYYATLKFQSPEESHAVR